jgi:hypothetical protein
MSDEDHIPEEEEEGFPPDRRKHGYKELEEKLDAHACEIKDQLATFIRRGLIAFGVIGLFTALALLGYGYLLREQHRTTDLIQDQRRDSILRGCQDQNARHEKTLSVLDQVIAKVLKTKPPDGVKKQLAVSRANNVLLIDALAPKQDCAKLVVEAVPKTAP